MVSSEENTIDPYGVPAPASSDEALMQGIKDRDEASFEALYDRYSSVVYALCLRVLRRPVDAQAVLSEIFWELWEKGERYNPDRGTPRNYLLTLARSRAIDRSRSESSRFHREEAARRERDGEFRARETAAEPVRKMVAEEERKMVVAAFSNLPDNQRETLSLAYYEGLSHSEIAAKLEMPLGTVKTHIRQGLLKLRHAITPHQEAARNR